jgi:hypothetical protein
MEYYLCKTRKHMGKKITTITLEDILNTLYEETFIKADGFDDCIIGVEGDTSRLVYSTQLCIQKLIKNEGMTREDAEEYFSFNIQGAKGEGYPLFILDYLWFKEH